MSPHPGAQVRLGEPEPRLRLDPSPLSCDSQKTPVCRASSPLQNQDGNGYELAG